MAATQESILLTEGLADFLATGPTPEEIVTYRPSSKVQKRARALNQKMKENRLSSDEEWELEVFNYAESLMRLVKAKARTPAKKS